MDLSIKSTNNFDPFKGSAKPLFAEYDDSVKDFAEFIIQSDFNLKTPEIDALLEKLNIGQYFSHPRTLINFSFELNSYSIDLATNQVKNEIEIHGKMLSFWVNFLNQTNNMGKNVASSLVGNISASAPRMFKNYIFGIRGSRHRHSRITSFKICSKKELQQKLYDFKTYFKGTGARIPTEKDIFTECIAHLLKLADTDGRIRNEKAISLYENVKLVFEKQEILEIEQIIDKTTSDL